MNTNLASESAANSNLIVEAFNTLHASGFTPAELWKQNQELVEALETMLHEFYPIADSRREIYQDEAYKKAETALKNAKQ